jgi:hypothetical protein
MPARPGLISRTSAQILETAIRLALKITCVVAGFATAKLLHGNAADRTGSLIFVAVAIAAFAALRPIAYRLYPELRRSDLRRLKRGPNPTTLASLGILVVIFCAFLLSVWCGVVLVSVIAAGALFALVIGMRHRNKARQADV